MIKPSGAELDRRMTAFRARMDVLDPEWRLTVVLTKINLYYFTGTMQNAALFIPRDGRAMLFVRKSHPRALDESEFGEIHPIRSFRDIPGMMTVDTDTVHIETEHLPMAHYQRLAKYFPFEHTRPADTAIMQARSVKSDFELDLMRKSGAIHAHVIDEFLPTLLRQGMSEAELGAKVLSEMILNGGQGVSRLSAFNAELFLGNVCFGESANYYNSFDGPAGIRGMSPGVPLMGSRDVTLKQNEPVLVDSACGVGGYHTDKTAIFVLGDLPDSAYIAHDACVAVQNRVAELLRPGTTPAEAYKTALSELPDELSDHFMGFGPNQVKFLGHGIGLVVDEYPAIANGFDVPVEENMVFAIEPKVGIGGLGMVGTENTFVIGRTGTESITGTTFNVIRA